MGIFSIPTDFFLFKCIISQKTSPFVQGSQKKKFGDDKILFGVLVSSILDAIFGPMFMK